MAPLRVLVVQDSAGGGSFVIRALERAGYTVEPTRVETAGAMSAALDAGAWDLVLTDRDLPTFTPVAALELLQQRGLDLPVIVYSENSTEGAAVGAVETAAPDAVMHASLARLRQTEARLRLLNNISRRVKLGTTTDEVVDHIVREMAAHFSEYRVSYGIVDARRIIIRYVLGTAELPPVVGRVVDLTESPGLTTILERGEPLVIERAEYDDRLGRFGLRLRDWNVAALLLTPLRVGGQLKAVLGLASPEPHAWAQHERTTLGEVAEYLELAMAEAEAQEQRRRVESALSIFEERVRQAHKMEALGRLAGGIAHDFNNLLTAIIGYSELVLAELPGGDDLLRHDVLEIKQAGDRAAALTRQLLAFSRQQILEPRVVDLNAVVRNMDQLLRRLIGEDVDLAAEPAADLGRTMADPGQLGQVIMNLALNARDAMPKGGRLTIRTRNVALTGEEALALGASPGPYVLLEVEDNGCGMDADTQSRAFEPFFTTKDPSKGTGLGLATVYGIVQQSHGFIAITSAPQAGTTFHIYLPRVGAPATDRRPAGASRAQD